MTPRLDERDERQLREHHKSHEDDECWCPCLGIATRLARSGSLDEAWAEAEAAEAEAALWGGYHLETLYWTGHETDWTARAGRPEDTIIGRGPTPAAALHALAAKLREAKS